MLLQNCCYFWMLLRLKQSYLKMLLPLRSSFTFSFPGWLYQGLGVALGNKCTLRDVFLCSPTGASGCGAGLDGRRMGQWLWVLTSCWDLGQWRPRGSWHPLCQGFLSPPKGCRLHLGESLLPVLDLQDGTWFGKLSEWHKRIPWQTGSSLRGKPSAFLLNHHQGWVLLTSPLSSQEVLEGKAQWKTKCHIINLYFGEIFLSTEQTSQVTHLFNGVYYFIIAGCYNGQLKHDKQKQQKCDIVDDQISFPYICFVYLHSSPLCFLWWAVIKAWNSCLPTLPSHVNFALGMSLLQTAFLIMVPEHRLHGEEHTKKMFKFLEKT